MSKKPRMKSLNILFCTPEVVPFSKTGGLGDVAGALPTALSRLGHSVRVVTPLYRSIDPGKFGIRERIPDFPVRLGGRTEQGTLCEGSFPGTDIPVYFIGHPTYFSREGFYHDKGKDYPDNLERFAFFCKAVLELLPRLGWKPQVVHANDWQTALLPVYLKTLFGETEFYGEIGTLFTLHNLGYQALFDRKDFPLTGLGWDLFNIDGLEYYGRGNLLKGGILFSDIVTTVSPTYSREIRTAEYGFGLEGVLRRREADLYGVLNGMDEEEWNPSSDSFIPKRYSVKSLTGKKACKRALQKEFDLPESNGPLVAVISRLDRQKGFDLILEIVEEMMQTDLQMVVLGSGEPEIQKRLQAFAVKYPDRIAVKFAFDNALAHRIEAGADLFLMPSRYEPCGLNQLYSLKYGTLPVARKTGGLADTITDFIPSTVRAGTANGFLFGHYASNDLLKALLLALKTFEDRKVWRGMMVTGMASDFSWGRSAKKYVELYRKIIQKGGRTQ